MSDTSKWRNPIDRLQSSTNPPDSTRKRRGKRSSRLSGFDPRTSAMEHQEELKAPQGVREMIDASRRQDLENRLRKSQALEARIASLSGVTNIYHAADAEPFLQVIRDAGRGNKPEIQELRRTMNDFYRIDKGIEDGTKKIKDAKQIIASAEEDIGIDNIYQKKYQLGQSNKEPEVRLSNTPDNKEIEVRLSNTPDRIEREFNVSNNLDGISRLLDTFARRLHKYKEEYKSAEQNLSKNDIPPEAKKSLTDNIDRSLYFTVSCRDIVHTLARRLERDIEGKIEEQGSRYDQMVQAIDGQFKIIREENKASQAELKEKLESLEHPTSSR